MFLAIALGAGLVAGRLVRGATTDPASVGSGSGTGTPQLSGPTPSAYPAPAASGYLASPPPLTAGSGYGAPASEWAATPAGGFGDPR